MMGVVEDDARVVTESSHAGLRPSGVLEGVLLDPSECVNVPLCREV